MWIICLGTDERCVDTTRFYFFFDVSAGGFIIIIIPRRNVRNELCTSLEV